MVPGFQKKAKCGECGSPVELKDALRGCSALRKESWCVRMRRALQAAGGSAESTFTAMRDH